MSNIKLKWSKPLPDITIMICRNYHTHSCIFYIIIVSCITVSMMYLISYIQLDILCYIYMYSSVDNMISSSSENLSCKTSCVIYYCMLTLRQHVLSYYWISCSAWGSRQYRRSHLKLRQHLSQETSSFTHRRKSSSKSQLC
jgi:hypothetical protein